MITIKKRNFGLDILRSFAILLVLISHINYLIDIQNIKFNSICGLLGYTGVELFFVLSGFLIGSILLKGFLNNEISIPFIVNFLKRRWLRTLPSYYLILIINIVIAYFFNFENINYALYLLFFQNLFTYQISFFSESWSLSVEEWAYLLIPFFLLIVNKIYVFKKKWLFIYSIFGLILIFHIIRFLNPNFNTISTLNEWNLHIKSVVIFRIDAILWGFVLAWLFYFYSDKLYKYRVYFLIFAAHLYVLQFFTLNILRIEVHSFPIYFKVFYFTFSSITIMFAFPFFLYFEKISIFVKKIFEILSKISYSAYLVHYSIISMLLKNNDFFGLNQSNFNKILIYFIAIFIISSILYQLFEKPILKYRDKNY